ncbi:hypothetical protein HPG69_018193 [Diceros bicornis minor]|uniref:C-type lectin domain-containing protein n=1 Tax=Diceros bicornis minor TaxID=77932 RepID=A0A7J7FN02_DICBM|nr:hypothetical protein HPG69_018193 [Diceros bicornis minor]
MMTITRTWRHPTRTFLLSQLRWLHRDLQGQVSWGWGTAGPVPALPCSGPEQPTLLPSSGKKTENPPRPCKPPKVTGLDLTPVTFTSPQLGEQWEDPLRILRRDTWKSCLQFPSSNQRTNQRGWGPLILEDRVFQQLLSSDLEHPPFQPSLATPATATPVPWLSQKSGGPGCHQEERLMVYLCLLVVVSLLLGCTGLAVTLIKYQEMVEELRMLTFQQMAWRANVTGMAGLAGLKKDIDHIRANTNQSLAELRGLLDCSRVTCPEGWLPFEGKCYYFSPSTKPWDEARTFCQENYSHLVIISSFAEQNFVTKAHGSPRVYWLGLNDRDREGDWSFWDPEEPNNMHDEDCASMNKGGTWNDLSCDKTTYWICERKCSC